MFSFAKTWGVPICFALTTVACTIYYVLLSDTELSSFDSVLLTDVADTDRTGKRPVEILLRSETKATSVQADVSSCFHQPAIDCRTPNTYLIYIYTDRNKPQRRQLIRNTWGRLDQYRNFKVNLQLFFVLGRSRDDDVERNGGGPAASFLDAEIRQHRDILMCNFIDTYDNLTLKGLTTLKWVNSTCNRSSVEFLFKTDDDVYVVVPKVLALAKEAIENGSHFLGVMSHNGTVRRSGKWAVTQEEYSSDSYPGYCVGGGYGITRRGFVLLMDSVDKVPLFRMEDVFFTGLAIRMAHPQTEIYYSDIDYHHARMLLSEYQIEKTLKSKPKTEKFILGHPISEHLWYKLHNVLNNISQST